MAFHSARKDILTSAASFRTEGIRRYCCVLNRDHVCCVFPSVPRRCQKTGENNQSQSQSEADKCAKYLRDSMEKSCRLERAEALLLFSKMHTVYRNRIEKHITYVSERENRIFDDSTATSIRCWSVLDALEDAIIHFSPCELDMILLRVM